MEPGSEQYRKLPGHRRGILRGASLWLGSDHFLSVKSLRFREEYKRFYLRDVQAIVVAQVPRFHISTRSIVIACLWVAVFLSTRTLRPWVVPAMWSAAVCLVFAWAYISTKSSCRCRIFTAVSSEELPSVYRTWTAKKFLEELEPRIQAVQGVLEGGWAEAVESREVGPPGTMRPIPSDNVVIVPGGTGVPPPPRPVIPNRTWVSDIFIASLFADAGLNLATLHAYTNTVQWVWYFLAFLQVAGAVAIFVQHYRGAVKSSMQKLAIATLVAMGLSYYFRQVLEGISGATRSMIPNSTTLAGTPGYMLVREVDAAVSLGLAIAGVVFAFSRRETWGRS
ncbi:MAG TPA: hypothetical protein VKU19_30565 [Bryobacteraceae bacterium]|nr:hypothetical protein [Bryobacteraceae bacterium]